MPKISELPIIELPPENNKQDLTEVIEGQVEPDLQIVRSVRKSLHEIGPIKQMPESFKPLRLTEQSNWYGKLAYSAAELESGVVFVELRIELPPDPEEQVFYEELSPLALGNPDVLKEVLWEAVLNNYVFRNLDRKDGQERKGLSDGDVNRVQEIAQEIFETFNPPDSNN